MTRTVQQLFNLEGKTALVTGGSRGLGLQMAHALGEAGARIMLSSRKAGDLEEAVADLQAAPGQQPEQRQRPEQGGQGEHEQALAHGVLDRLRPRAVVLGDDGEVGPAGAQ